MREANQTNTITYEAEVVTDGQLPLPKNVKLRRGQKVRVSLRIARKGRSAARRRDALWDIVGMFRSTDGKTDVAERHDYYLYGRGSKNRKAGEV